MFSFFFRCVLIEFRNFSSFFAYYCCLFLVLHFNTSKNNFEMLISSHFLRSSARLCRNIAFRPVSTMLGHSRGLDIQEPLIFEQSEKDRQGVNTQVKAETRNFFGGMENTKEIGLSGMSEGQVMRHYVKLSQKNYGIDTGVYPLGSCTMKYNPRINEVVSRYPGLSDIHPLQPTKTVQGALEVMFNLQEWLKTLTGMPGITLNPAAGSHGEFCGLMSFRTAHKANGQSKRKKILIPESAHGTNPASAAMCGFKCVSIPCNSTGKVDMEKLKQAMGEDVAGVMVTNPNTCGLFEEDIANIADVMHTHGAYMYMDGANFNALLGRVRPADLGVDAMHINLHKTFSTPHGGGGPGSGPVVFSDRVKDYAPVPVVRQTAKGGFELVENVSDQPLSFGRGKPFHGQMGMFVRALAYCKAYGTHFSQVSGDAVLNANYVLARLSKELSPAFGTTRCMHEALFTDENLTKVGTTTLDVAKSLLDAGFHPMTMYFPLVVSGAMLIEPTETEDKQSLDSFCDAILDIFHRAKEGKQHDLHEAPVHTPIRRADETLANRKPVLKYHQ
eukprot:GCRY01001182.1.p1 GENE.GCRY01001182.1~~GCRY01001182.1.p1  ORF type:complete len:557 (-),score=135.45 GCRY01001182.1:338-2008(-)